MKVLLLLSIFIFSLYAEDSAEWTVPQPTPSECSFSCPQVKSGFYTRLKDTSPLTGSTTCFVYSSSGTEPLGVVSYQNQKCIEKLAEIEDMPENIETQIKSGYDNIQKNRETIAQEIKNGYAQTGETKFLKTSEFLLALFGMDPAIIKLQASLQSGEINIDERYTIYPATTYSNTSFFQTFVAAIKKYALLGLFDDSQSVKDLKNLQNQEAISISDALITKRYTMLIDFATGIDSIVREAVWIIVSLLFLFISAKIAISYIGKDDQAKEKMQVRGAWIVFIFLLVMMPKSNEIVVTNGGEEVRTSSTIGQETVLALYGSMMKLADRMSMLYADTVAQKLIQETGFVAPSITKQNWRQREYITKVEQPQLAGTLEKCAQYYGEEIPRAINEDVEYSTDGIRNTTYVKLLMDQGIDNGNLPLLANIPTITACSNALRAYTLNKKRIENYSNQIESATGAGGEMNEHLLEVVKQIYQEQAEMGFLASPGLTSKLILVDNLGISNIKEEREANMEKLEEKSDRGMITEFSSFVIGSLPWATLPGFSSLHSTFMTMLDGAANAASGSFGAITSMIPMGRVLAIGSKIKGIFDGAKEKIGGGADGVVDTIQYILAFAGAVWAYMTLLEYLPLAVISAMGYFLIGIFYLVEVFLFLKLLPAAFLAAFARDVQGTGGKIVKNIVIFSISPILIVLTMFVLTMFTMMFTDIGNGLSNSQFLAMESLVVNNATLGVISSDFVGLSFAKGVLTIVYSVLLIFAIPIIFVKVPGWVIGFFDSDKHASTFNDGIQELSSQAARTNLI